MPSLAPFAVDVKGEVCRARDYLKLVSKVEATPAQEEIAKAG